MKRPLDKSLAQWIRELEQEGKLYRFYKCDEWLRLRDDVLFDAHYECEDCAAKGKYERAYLVHHEMEVRDHPELALSRTYRDGSGKVRKQLWALCYRCHEVRHGRMFPGNNGMKREPSELELRIPERW